MSKFKSGDRVKIAAWGCPCPSCMEFKGKVGVVAAINDGLHQVQVNGKSYFVAEKRLTLLDMENE